MAVVRCPKGHFYDDQRFSHCPHCGVFSEPAGGAGGESVKASPSVEKKKGIFGWLDREKTVAFSSEKEAEASSLGDEHTVALKNVSDNDEDDQKTIGFFSGAKGNDFVTGWLVCVEGKEKGRDYRLHHGFNRVGRNFTMDVQVMEDPEISEETHCSIVYDDKTNRFSLIPSNGAITYYKGRMISGPETLQSGDELCIGKSRFVFIPFCGEGRLWEKEEK